MPLEIDDVSIRIIGNNYKALQFYDDGRTLQQEIYLQSDNTLNIGDTETGGGTGSAMPAFKDTLSETDRWRIIRFLRTL